MTTPHETKEDRERLRLLQAEDVERRNQRTLQTLIAWKIGECRRIGVRFTCQDMIDLRERVFGSSAASVVQPLARPKSLLRLVEKPRN